jgi:hypothetical protein
MKPDAGLQPIRDIRLKISRELGNDPRRLVEYYMAYQQKLRTRLRSAPGAGSQGTAEAAAGDRASSGP